MKTVLRAIVFSALTLILLGSACTLPAQEPPTPLATFLVTEQSTASTTPTSTLTNETPTAFIPITGMDVVSLQCQFCVNNEAHAVLIMSNLTFFHVADPASGVTCLTAKEVNDRRIVLCRGEQQATFQLDVCVDDSNCLQFPVTFQGCPLVPATGLGTPIVTFTPAAPILLTPINTLRPKPTSEPDDPVPTPTPRRATPPPASTTAPPPPPTSTNEPPPPTEEPTEPPTAEPTDPPATEEPTEPSVTEPPADPPTSSIKPTKPPKPTKIPKPTRTERP